MNRSDSTYYHRRSPEHVHTKPLGLTNAECITSRDILKDSHKRSAESVIGNNSLEYFNSPTETLKKGRLWSELQHLLTSLKFE